MSRKIVGLDGVNIERPSNQEFINFCIDRSNFGPLTELAIIESMRFYTKMVVDAGVPKDLEGSLINPKAWYDCCKDLNEKLVKHYEG